MTVTTGNPFTLECVVAGTPELLAKWFKDGRELAAGSRHHITFARNLASLKIPSAEMNDKGLYSCEVQNSVGKSSCTVSVHVSGEYDEAQLETASPAGVGAEERSLSGNLSPLDRIVPPSFIRKLKDTNATLGASVVLECRVSGSAPISVGWFLDGSEVVRSPKCQPGFSDNVCTLSLNSLEPSDTGTYTCVAANEAGQDESSAILTVQGQCPGTPCCFSPHCPAFVFILPS